MSKSVSLSSMENPLKDAPPIQQKITGTVISFFISLGIFIMIRVIGVLYLGDTFVDIVNFDPFAALNVMVWVGIITVIIIGAIILNFTISTDKSKISMDLISATVLTIGLFWMISYNYVGFTYPSLLQGKDVFQRIFVYGTYWISVFAVYGNSDLFLFWLMVSGVFHGVFFLFSIADLDEKMFSLFKKRSRTKNAPSLRDVEKSVYSAFDFFAIEVVAVFTNAIVLYLPMSILVPGLSEKLFTIEGIFMLIIFSSLNVLFYILSKRMQGKAKGFLFYAVVSIIFTCINMLFLVMQSTLLALLLITIAIIIVAAVSNLMIKK